MDPKTEKVSWYSISAPQRQDEIIIIMKIFNRPEESDSFSTQERQKKFNRKNDNGLSKSKSNHSRSESKSISKFFVRNLQTDAKPNRMQDVLTKNIKGALNWSPPRRPSTPAKTEAEKKIKYTKQQLIDSQAKQIEYLQNQISKYKAYIYQNSEKSYKVTQENKALQQEVVNLRKRIAQQQVTIINLRQQVATIKEVLNNKQAMLEYWQKEQPSIKKVKTAIFQTRIMEFEKQREEMNLKIRELEKVIENLKGHESSMVKSPSRDFSCQGGSFLESQDERVQSLQSQLYEAKEIIKKLQITDACNKRKFYKQMEAFKQKKDQQYIDLKKKFSEFLAKYKLTMKKFASFQIKIAVEKRSDHNCSSLQSLGSLTLSQDQQQY